MEKSFTATLIYVEDRDNVVYTMGKGGLGLVHMDVNDWWLDIYTATNGIITILMVVLSAVRLLKDVEYLSFIVNKL